MCNSNAIVTSFLQKSNRFLKVIIKCEVCRPYLEKVTANPYFCTMKKMALYLLILIVAISTTGLEEVCKLPAFVSHYLEHKEAVTTTGIANFIAMHYLGQDAKDNDDSKDNQLPFKNYHSQLHYLYYIPVKQNDNLFLAFAKVIIDIPYKPYSVKEFATANHFRPPCC